MNGNSLNPDLNDFRNSISVDSSTRPFVIAEINTGHFGEMEKAIDAIKIAAGAGCNCIKFQSFSPNSLYSKRYLEEHKIESRMYSKLSLHNDELRELSVEALTSGIGFSSTVYSLAEAEFLAGLPNVSFIKIASMDIDNLDLIRGVCRLGLPVVLSSGMATVEEVAAAVEACHESTYQKIVVLHCVSLYPTPIGDLNILNIDLLSRMFPNVEIGFSDHSEGTLAGGFAVVRGARVIEKHLTLDKARPGFDNAMALDAMEMQEYVSNCHAALRSLGSPERVLTDAEIEQRQKMRRSLVYSKSMKVGELLTSDQIELRRPGTGIPVSGLGEILGRRLLIDVVEGDFVRLDHLV